MKTQNVFVAEDGAIFEDEKDCQDWERVSAAIRQLRQHMPDEMEVPEILLEEGQEFLDVLCSKGSLSTRLSDVILERARRMKRLADQMFPAAY